MRAFKLFRTMKSRPGELFPLFIDRATAVPVGRWVDADFVPTKGYAPRPGWHVAPEPNAPHLCKRDGSMPDDRVWAEVEIPDTDGGWQAVADASPTGDIRDRVPEGGFYRFPRPKNQGGEWLIAGSMRVVRVLTEGDDDPLPPSSAIGTGCPECRGGTIIAKPGCLICDSCSWAHIERGAC